ncbi:ribonuclease P complex subunit Pop1 [Pyronema domesticum]|nr:ribonuclease P complex subunit Pop1 [Pyronema domesticum]
MSTPNNNPTPGSKKRPLDTTPTNSNAAFKRARVQHARSIITQTAIPELKTGLLNVSSFISSRKFEISALQRSMDTSKKALKQRAFQSVPRELRRRTAAHNAKRVPKHLRGRAKREMEEDNTPTHTFRRRKKSGKDYLRRETAEKLQRMAKKKEVVERLVKDEEGLRMPPRAHSKYRKRQKGKTWLPTHVWHAKRAHMKVRWRFAVVESPNEKCFRSTQRAVEKRGGVAWDMSYWSSVLVRGPEEEVVKVLEAVCPGGSGDKKTRAGRRVKEVWAYEVGHYPTRPIAPITIIWSPCEAAESTEAANTPRRVLLRLHPSAFHQLWSQLHAAVAIINIPTKLIFLDDLRFELGSIKLTGPSATDALITILNPSNPSGETETHFQNLRGLTNPAALPPNVVLGFSITDPRLRFPPRLEPSPFTPAEQAQKLATLQSTWPLIPAPHALLDPTIRVAAVKLQASQKRINKRKTDSPPGTYPTPLASDPSVPIILHASRHGTAPGEWHLIMPWKWVGPVWYCLQQNHNIRFGGVKEDREVAFDHCTPWFPADFPGTMAGEAWAVEEQQGRRELWDKRPPQKRVNYEAIKIAGKRGELGDWSRCDWEILMPEAEVEAEAEDADKDEGGVSLSTPMETDATTTTELALSQKSKPYWHLPTPLLTASLRLHPLLPPALSSLPPTTLSSSIFTIKITLLHRGAPKDCARVYRLPSNPDDPWRKLAAAIQKSKGGKKYQKTEAGVVEAGMEGYPECPEEDCLVGYVTTGNYSLTQGHAVALGGVVWGRWWSGQQDKGERLVVVRNVGDTVGRLGRWEGV